MWFDKPFKMDIDNQNKYWDEVLECYLAFDAGEFYHSNDNSSMDPFKNSK